MEVGGGVRGWMWGDEGWVGRGRGTKERMGGMGGGMQDQVGTCRIYMGDRRI